MKTISIKTLATGIVASTLLFAASCKKGDTGPAGANGTNGLVATSTDGYIKGTITGTRQDGTSFIENYDFENYYGTPSGTLDSTGINSVEFDINRSMDVFGRNSASIAITATTPTASTGTLSLNNFNFTKSLGTNKEFVFSVNNNTTAQVNPLTYNSSNGMFTGSTSVVSNALGNSTAHSATITIQYQATITQLYMLVHHNGNAVKTNASNN
ncbi:MAG: hypothetical protein ABI388_02245 [Bacteroidia bacterium]